MGFIYAGDGSNLTFEAPASAGNLAALDASGKIYDSGIGAGEVGESNIWTSLPFFAQSTPFEWTNMPAGETEALYSRRGIDLTYATHYRLQAYQTVAGAAGAKMNIQYSTNGTDWYACDTAAAGALAVGAGTGAKVGATAALVSGAKQAVLIRLVGVYGDGATDPAFTAVIAQFKSPVGGI